VYDICFTRLMFFKIVFFTCSSLLLKLCPVGLAIPRPGKQSSFVGADSFKVKSGSLPMCSWRQPANARGTHSKQMHFFNQLPFAWIEEMNEVWHDCHHFFCILFFKSSPGKLAWSKVRNNRVQTWHARAYTHNIENVESETNRREISISWAKTIRHR